MASPFSCASFSTFKPTIESEGRPLYYYFSVNDLSTGALLVKNSKYTLSFFLSLLVRSYMSITPGSANLEILIK